MKKICLIFIFIIYSSIIFTSSKCSENQIDINAASLEELEKITQIGPIYAQRIIDIRPFENLNDLTKVNGIAEKRLSKIKEQDLACVDILDNETKENNKEKSEESKMMSNNLINRDINEQEFQQSQKKEKQKIERLEIIKLKANPKTIKSDFSEKEQGKNNYPVYGFIVFSILIIILFILKNKKENKNEFN